jgi:hypothetical protein
MARRWDCEQQAEPFGDDRLRPTLRPGQRRLAARPLPMKSILALAAIFSRAYGPNGMRTTLFTPSSWAVSLGSGFNLLKR